MLGMCSKYRKKNIFIKGDVDKKDLEQIKGVVDVIKHADEWEVKIENDLVTEKFLDTCINLLKNYIEYYSPKSFKTTQILEGIR